MLEQGYPSGRGWRRRHVLRGLLGMAGMLPRPGLPAPAPEPAPLALQPLGPERWWLPASDRGPDPGNGGLTAQLVAVRDGERLWLVGSGPTPAMGAQLAIALRSVSGLAVTDIVHTRAAPELAMGNVAFPGARSWALPEVLKAMELRCLECQSRLKAQIGVAGDSLQPDAIRPPTLPIGLPGQAEGVLGPFDWRAFERGPGERVLALRHGSSLPGAPGDDPGLVIAQGLVWVHDVPDLHGLQSESVRSAWVALQAWTGRAWVLGEQGGLGDSAAIADHVAYLDALRLAIEPYLAQGDLWGAVGGGLALPEFMQRPGYLSRHPLNVQRMWLELEPTIFR